MKKLFFSLIFSCIFLGVLSFKNVHAQNTSIQEFALKFNTSYIFEETGETSVKQEISIINMQDSVIPKTYTIIVRDIEVAQVEAFDQNKDELKTEVEKVGQENRIKIELKNFLIGEGKENKLIVQYKTTSMAEKIGSIWHISVPRVNLPSETAEYQTTLEIPSSYGKEIFISPAPESIIYKENSTLYKYSLAQLQNFGIGGTFGNTQLINFTLVYSIKNDSKFDTKKSIVIPSDIIDAQQIAIASIDPEPKRVALDEHGNSYGEYSLKSGEELNIILQGSAQIISRKLDLTQGGAFSEIRKSTKKYTKQNENWQTKDMELSETAEQILNTSQSVVKNAYEIYKYILTNISYEYSETEIKPRKGAALTLKEGEAGTATDLNDLFIALCRSAGIPAREVVGLVLTSDAKGEAHTGPHTWAEIFDPKLGWVQVDTALAKTTSIDSFARLNADHFAIIRKDYNLNLSLPKMPSNLNQGYTEQASKIFFDTESEVSTKTTEPIRTKGTFEPNFVVYKSILFNPFTLGSERIAYLSNTGNVALHPLDVISKQKNTTILQNQTKTIYIKKGYSSITLREPTGKIISLSYAPKVSYALLAKDLVVLLLFLALPLCMISYLLVSLVKNRKKLPRRPYLLHQVLNLLPTRRSK